MTDPKIIFDTLDVTTGAGYTIFSFIFNIGFPSLVIFFVILGFRNAHTKSKKTMMILLGAVGAVLLLAGIGSFITDPGATERRQIENHDYTIVRGKITKLTESTIIAGNPAATFEVADHVFQYGRGSDNYKLNMVEKDGILSNGRSVEIWYKNDKILRILSASEESK